MSMETDTPRFPKKAFLSRARSSSTSISSCGSNGGRNSGIDLLAEGSEMLAVRQVRDDTAALPDGGRDNSFASKRSREDSLSYISLPDEMKVSFSELEDTGLNLNDLDFNACPQSVEDASNVTLDLTPRPDNFNEEEIETSQYSGISSTSCIEDQSSTNSYLRNAQNYNSVADKSGNTCSSESVGTSAASIQMPQTQVGNKNSSASSNSAELGTSSSIKVTTPTTGSQPAEPGIGSLIKSSSSVLADKNSYENWNTVTELPWADDRLVDEIAQVSTTVESSTEDLPKKKRRTCSLSKNKKLDNILCQVCGDLAAGFYCGAYICEACKKFYMRAHKQEKLKYVCLREKKCVITKESRVQCQYCRYQKCLSLNMYCPKQGSEGESSKEAQMSDIPCRVCSAPSSGFHFGAITCEGCKGFFRRMAKEREPERYQCTKDGNCEINMMTRNLCKACRYKACLRVGMSVEGSRIGRQPNAVKHEISLELKQGVRTDLGNKARHTSGPAEVKIEPVQDQHTSDPVIVEVDQLKQRHNSSPVKIKQEPLEFKESCSMSGTQKSTSWKEWGSENVENPFMEKSVTIPGLIAATKTHPHTDSIISLGKPATLFRDILLNKATSAHISDDSGKLGEGESISEKRILSEVPFTSDISSGTSVYSHNINSQTTLFNSCPGKLAQKSVSREAAQNSSRDTIPQASSSKWNPPAIFSLVPISSETDTDSSSVDEEPSRKHKEMMTLINGIIEAGRCLELINYRVFDTDLFEECKWVVEDVKQKFKDRFMDPKFQVPPKFKVDMSQFDTHESAWSTMMTDFNQHAYNTIKFAKHIPGFRTLSIHDQSVLLRESIYPIVLLHLSKVYDVETKAYNYFNLTKQEEAAIMRLFPMFKILLLHFQHIGHMVTSLNVNNEEYSFLAAILLCQAGFRTLSIQDQSVLLRTGVYPVVLLYLSKVYDIETKTHNYFNFTKQEEERVLTLFPMLRVLRQHLQHVGEMTQMLKLTNEEYSLLAAVLLLPAEVSGLKEPAKVEELQFKMSNALQYYEENTYEDGAVRYGSLLVRIAELVQCMLQHRLAIGLVMTAHPELRHVQTGQLFEELVMECSSVL